MSQKKLFKNLSAYLQSLPKECKCSIGIDNTYFSVIDRFETTGKVKPEILSPLHITGPVCEGFWKNDGHPNQPSIRLIQDLNLKGRTLPNGDVLARFNLKVEEVLDSVKIIQNIINQFEGGDVS